MVHHESVHLDGLLHTGRTRTGTAPTADSPNGPFRTSFPTSNTASSSAAPARGAPTRRSRHARDEVGPTELPELLVTSVGSMLFLHTASDLRGYAQADRGKLGSTAYPVPGADTGHHPRCPQGRQEPGGQIALYTGD